MKNIHLKKQMRFKLLANPNTYNYLQIDKSPHSLIKAKNVFIKTK